MNIKYCILKNLLHIYWRAKKREAVLIHEDRLMNPLPTHSLNCINVIMTFLDRLPMWYKSKRNKLFLLRQNNKWVSLNTVVKESKFLTSNVLLVVLYAAGNNQNDICWNTGDLRYNWFYICAKSKTSKSNKIKIYYRLKKREHCNTGGTQSFL